MAEIKDVHLHIHTEDELSRKLDEILRMLRTLVKVEVIEVANLDAVRDAVAANTDVVNSAVQLVASLADQLQAAANDPAEVQALAEQLRANNQALADAVVANTPAAPPTGAVVEGPAGATEGPGPEEVV